MTRLTVGIVVLTAHLFLVMVVAGSAAGPVRRTSLAGPTSCYPRPHVHSHERQPLTAARAALVRAFWQVARLPECGVAPLAQTLAGWERRWLNPAP